MRERELAMQAALADLRAAEAAIETQRAFQAEQAEGVGQAQGRYYAVGADITRSEQQIQFARENRERQRNDLAQSRAGLEAIAAQVERDEQELRNVRAELERLAPGIEAAQAAERDAVAGRAAAEERQTGWQRHWEQYNAESGAAQQTVQVERARIEQLENQLHRLRTQRDRLAVERDVLVAQETQGQLFELGEREAQARTAADELARALTTALTNVQGLRTEQFACESRLESARGDRERARAEVMSVDALQRAALGRADAGATAGLRSTGLADRPRLAEALTVEQGWEKAVETVLGEHLEAVCVEGIDALLDSLGGLSGTRLALLEDGPRVGGGIVGTLAARVRGPEGALALLSGVRVADGLAAALALRRSLAPGESVVTRSGEWLGRGWLRVARGGDAHAGVLERGSRLKDLRAVLDTADARVREAENALATTRTALGVAEAARDATQGRIQQAHRAHADLLGQLEAGRARAQESTLRRERLEEESAGVLRELGFAEDTLARARAELERGLARVAELDGRRPALDASREETRDAVLAAREAAQNAQLAARDLMVRAEGRRTAETA
ncbi:MAG: hypothetical protein ACKO7G_05810, partial [Gammaproteobacteria bacterium]